MEKNATLDSTIAIHRIIAHVTFTCELLIIVKLNPKIASEIVWPAALVRINGRRPARSRRKVATKMKAVLTIPTATVASNL